MTVSEVPGGELRLLPSGEEAGTAPDDRRFRPDVEGLRALAVLLVVLYHAGFPHLTGGYIGVDVFFVISGFVITGLLLRERRGTGRTSIVDFYARRVRRILPAATLVIGVTVIAAFVVLGVLSGSSTANDGRWAAVFLANFHFESVGTNYLTAKLPPSPLQNYWSLSVEEQFYVVYPTLFLFVASLRSRLDLRARLAVILCAIIVASYWLSIVQTSSHPAAAYFSPLTRAWELALGALVAVGTSWLRKVPVAAASSLTWIGVTAIIYSAFAFNSQTVYPGSLVVVPVVGAAMIIAGGAAVPRWGAESVLGPRPVQWLGRRSYSLYLWHWPILILAAERVDKSQLTFRESLPFLVVAVVASIVSYRYVENPLRHVRVPSKQTVGAGVALVLATVAMLTLAITFETSTPTKERVVPRRTKPRSTMRSRSHPESRRCQMTCFPHWDQHCVTSLASTTRSSDASWRQFAARSSPVSVHLATPMGAIYSYSMGTRMPSCGCRRSIRLPARHTGDWWSWPTSRVRLNWLPSAIRRRSEHPAHRMPIAPNSTRGRFP